MIASDTSGTAQAPNHPLAIRMGVIAGFSHNIVIGTIMGHFGVMLASVETRLAVSAKQVALGIPLILIGSALTAPIIGVLLSRVSLRLILLLGALLTVGGFAILGLTQSYPLFLLAYGLCFGPALSLTGSVGPATLVTRWFTRNRGLALGVVHLPVVIAVLPVALNAYLESHGAQASYLALGTFATIALVPLTLLARDYPPGYRKSAATASGARTADGSFTVPQLLAAPRFWALCIAAIASMTSSVVLSALLVPMGVSWGFSRGQAALLASGMSAVGLLGSILFGWIADQLGGARALALIGLDCAILWALLALHWPFPMVAVIVGLIGMHGAGAIPTLSRGLSDVFGQASFSRAFGLNTIIGLPFIALGVIGAASVQAATGSYVPAQLAIAGFFVVAIGLALYAASGRKTPAVAPLLA